MHKTIILLTFKTLKTNIDNNTQLTYFRCNRMRLRNLIVIYNRAFNLIPPEFSLIYRSSYN